MPATLVLAAHGTRSAAGSATTQALVNAVAAARPAVPVSLGFLDVASPTLAESLDAAAGSDVVVVPLLLSAGYHVLSDIPALVEGRPGVRVAGHLGPDPLVVSAVAERLLTARGTPGSTTLLAAIASSRSEAATEVGQARELLARRLGCAVEPLRLGPDVATSLAAVSGPRSVAVYLLAEGGFLSSLRSMLGPDDVIAQPIGVHPALIALVWRRYDEACSRPVRAPDEVR